MDPLSASQLATLAVVGLLGGFVNAVAGGGSLVVFPALLAVGIHPLAANVTNAVAQWPGYAATVVSTRCDLVGQGKRVALTTAVVGVGAAIGAALLLVLPGQVFDQVVPALVIGASLLMAAGPWIRQRFRGSVNGDRPALLVPALFAAGVYGGYFGGALGVILIAALSVILADDLRRLNALKAVLSVAASSVTLIAFAFIAPVNWLAVGVIAPAALVGGYLGGTLARRIPERGLRWSVVLLGLAVGAYLAFG